MAASPASPDLHNASTSQPPTRTRALLLVNRKARRGKDDLSAALARLHDAGFEFVEERSKCRPSSPRWCGGTGTGSTQ